MKIRALLRKEWTELARNRVALSVVVLLPVVFILIPVGLLIATVSGAVPPSEFEELRRLQPHLAQLSDHDAMVVFVADQFLVLFLLLPLAVPETIAAHSVVGEKQARSLEPLLATPISTTELLIAKGVAAALPGLATTWVAYLVFLAGGGLAGGPVLVQALLGPKWLLAIALLAPLFCGLAVGVGLIISSRVNEVRVAEQLGMLVALPLFGLLIAQAVGALLIGPVLMLGLAAVAAGANLLTLRLAVRLFDRETILTRWG